MEQVEEIFEQIMAKGISESTCDNGLDMVKCPICGQYYNEFEYDNDICEECQEKLESEATIENALKIGEENTTSVEINGFLAQRFTESEINYALAKLLDGVYGTDKKVAKNYCLEDKESFNEFLERI